MKTFREEVREELMQSSTLYCCYCTTPKGENTTCCSEYHFVTFKDLYPSDQDMLIQDQVEDYEQWVKTQ